MPEFHSEPYLHLAGLTHKSALIAWGAFYFRIKEKSGEMKLVDDSALKKIHPPRRQTIGAKSEPYDDQAVVEVKDPSGKMFSVVANNANHCWVSGLEPDTEYTYKVFVNGEEWAEGERRDWINDGNKKGLVPSGRSYDNRFRTFPDPARDINELTFAVIGDYGRGIKKPSDNDRRQLEIARALEKATSDDGVRLILTTGDNIYASRILGIFPTESGDEDDDWFFTFYQPYRYILNRIPIYPCIGNHDAKESEEKDDRDQLYDNMYVKERIAADEPTERASLDPGLFYRFRFGSNIEFSCLDTSREEFLKDRLFKHPRHQHFLQLAFPAGGGGPRWKIPFSHHPRFCAGPRHSNTESMEFLVDFFRRAGVRAVFSGHEHNFQQSERDGISYFVSGGAGKRSSDAPKNFGNSHTVSWSSDCHFLIVNIAGQTMTVTPRGELDTNGNPTVIGRFDQNKRPLGGPVTVTADPMSSAAAARPGS